MRAFLRDLALTIAAPVAAELVGAWREYRHAEHEDAIALRRRMRESLHGQPEPSKVIA